MTTPTKLSVTLPKTGPLDRDVFLTLVEKEEVHTFDRNPFSLSADTAMGKACPYLEGTNSSTASLWGTPWVLRPSVLFHRRRGGRRGSGVKSRFEPYTLISPRVTREPSVLRQNVRSKPGVHLSGRQTTCHSKIQHRRLGPWS